MRCPERASQATDSTERVNQILSGLIGTRPDLRTESGRAEAFRRLDRKTAGAGFEADVVEAEAYDESRGADKRTAWEAARGYCGEIQLRSALKLLEGLKPLPEQGDGLDDTQAENFEDLKRQIGGEIAALREELKGEANAGALSNLFITLVGGGTPLFEKLREAGHYRNGGVNDRSDERVVIHYLAARALVAQLCDFPITCQGETLEPRDAGTKVGKGLGLLEGHLHCIDEVVEKIEADLAEQGITENCGAGTIPGIEFPRLSTGEPEESEAAEKAEKSKSSAAEKKGSRTKERNDTYRSGERPTPKDLSSLLRRSRAGSKRWRTALAKDGRDGAANVAPEIHRLSDLIRHFHPQPKNEDDPPRIAFLLETLIDEYDAAANVLVEELDIAR